MWKSQLIWENVDQISQPWYNFTILTRFRNSTKYITCYCEREKRKGYFAIFVLCSTLKNLTAIDCLLASCQEPSPAHDVLWYGLYTKPGHVWAKRCERWARSLLYSACNGSCQGTPPHGQPLKQGWRVHNCFVNIWMVGWLSFANVLF